MPLKNIEASWQEFSSLIYKKQQPSAIQLNEMRKAFFAGAWTVITDCMEIAQDHITEEQGIAHMERITAECHAFYLELKKEISRMN